MVNPNDRHHAKLEKDVVDHAQAHGWCVGSATYHEAMPEPVKVALSRCWDPAALYVRGRADRVAVKDQRCILFEAKTNSGRHVRAAIEAGPLCHYHRLGIACLYVYRDVKDGYESAFWTTNMPEPDAILIPAAWSWPMRQYFRKQLRSTWPDQDVSLIPPTNGSNDPFVCFSRDQLNEKAVQWRNVFMDAAVSEDILTGTPPPQRVERELDADDITWGW